MEGFGGQGCEAHVDRGDELNTACNGTVKRERGIRVVRLSVDAKGLK